jgi:hypothetical protein
MIHAIYQKFIEILVYIDTIPESIFVTAFVAVALVTVVGSWLYPKT